ncbi:MAG: VanW family protein [Bulleidia sp.]
MARKLFCEISPLTYEISLWKENIRHDIRDLVSHVRYAEEIRNDELPYIVKTHSSTILRNLEGVDMQLQKNKRKNLKLASETISGLVIQPNETFSFWHQIGKPDRKKGYLEGLIITSGRVESANGGGLCQLANLIHWLVLNSPLTVTELHHHSDALFPDSGRRVPFGTGTSVSWHNLDYRFKNTTDQPVQLLIHQDEQTLYGELRSLHAYENTWSITEEDAGFVNEDGVFYRVSKVYQLCHDKNGNLISKTLVLDNHSRVLYDYSLIPEDQIIFR